MLDLVGSGTRGKEKIADNVFVPKGQWIVGSSVSYSEHTEENYQF